MNIIEYKLIAGIIKSQHLIIADIVFFLHSRIIKVYKNWLQQERNRIENYKSKFSKNATKKKYCERILSEDKRYCVLFLSKRKKTQNITNKFQDKNIHQKVTNTIFPVTFKRQQKKNKNMNKF